MKQASHSKWPTASPRSEEHTSELQSRSDLVCRLLLEKKKFDLLRSPHIRQVKVNDGHIWTDGLRFPHSGKRIHIPASQHLTNHHSLNIPGGTLDRHSTR